MNDRKRKSHAHATKIPPGAYPVLSGAAAKALLGALRDPQVVARAAQVIADRVQDLHAAVMMHIDRIEDAARVDDPAALYAQAHEIRGLAGNAGLAATGRIANGLCRYLDAVGRLGRKSERPLVALHLDAIARAARAEDEATRLGDTVANELAALVEKKLAEINTSETRG